MRYRSSNVGPNYLQALGCGLRRPRGVFFFSRDTVQQTAWLAPRFPPCDACGERLTSHQMFPLPIYHGTPRPGGLWQMPQRTCVYDKSNSTKVLGYLLGLCLRRGRGRDQECVVHREESCPPPRGLPPPATSTSFTVLYLRRIWDDPSPRVFTVPPPHLPGSSCTAALLCPRPSSPSPPVHHPSNHQSADSLLGR